MGRITGDCNAFAKALHYKEIECREKVKVQRASLSLYTRRQLRCMATATYPTARTRFHVPTNTRLRPIRWSRTMSRRKTAPEGGGCVSIVALSTGRP